MFLNFFESQEENNFAALDIGTEYVKALVFSFDEEGKIIIKQIAKEKKDLNNKAAEAIIDVEAVSKICGNLLKNVCGASFPKCTVAIAGIAGDMLRGCVSTAHCERLNTKEKISVSEIKNIIQKVQWRNFDKIKRELSERGDFINSEFRIIDSKILKLELDGRLIENPVGMQGKNISFTIFNSAAPLFFVNSIQEIAKKLKLKNDRIVPCSFAAASLVRSINDVPKRLLVIDIGGAATDAAIIKEEKISFAGSLAIGGMAISKKIAFALGVGIAEAEDIKIKYSTGKLSEDADSSIGKILKEDIEIWARGIKILLKDKMGTGFFPFSVYLCGGGSLLPGISESLQKLFNGMEIRFILPEFLPDILSKKNRIISGVDDAGLIALVQFLKAVPDNDFLNQILKRTVTLMQS